MTITVQQPGATGGGGGGGGTVVPPPGTVAVRPIEISGCLQSFNETTLPNSIRTQSEDNQTIKVRRRATHPTRTAEASVTVEKTLVQSWRDWFNVNCQSGTIPTRFIMPWGDEEVWRFSSELSINWLHGNKGNHAATITFKLEQLPLFANW